MKYRLKIIKLIPPLVIALFAVFIFTACPDEMNHTPGYPDKEKIDKKLLGTWITEGDKADIFEVRISQMNDFACKVEALRTSSDYNVGSVNFTMWVTKIGKDRFLYAKADNKETFYVYHYKFSGKNKFELSQLNYQIEGKSGITSTETFRKEIELSMKLGGCLKETLTYSRK